MNGTGRISYAVNMMWIHEHKNWPYLTWDAEVIAPLLAKIRYKQGRLLGQMEGLGFNLKCEANLSTLTNDVVKSSAIEGEVLSQEEVRSSIAKHLGFEISDSIATTRNTDGIVEMMLDATQQYLQPLTIKRLFEWHSSLFPTGRSGMKLITVGDWRPERSGSMQVVSGPIGREKVRFEAPVASRLNEEISTFLAWLKTTQNTDPILKDGIAHLWFITIHI